MLYSGNEKDTKSRVAQACPDDMARHDQARAPGKSRISTLAGRPADTSDGFSPSVSSKKGTPGGRSKSRPEGAQGEQKPEVSARGEAPLDITAKSVDHSIAEKQRKQGRSNRFRWQRHAAGLLGGTARVGLCRWSVVSRAAGVDVVVTRHGDGRFAHYEGLQTCGSVWDCPCCAARISEIRRAELNALLAFSRARGFTVQMLTLTARHGHADKLSALLDGMKRAKQRWAQTRAYRSIKSEIVGSVTATEVTGGGANGWHPHFHIIVVTRHPVDLDALRDPWLSSLRWSGLDGTGAGWRVQDATEAGRYMAKWGAAEELTLSAKKKGRGGLTPTQLLAASCDDGDKQAGALWREYSAAFRGRRQLVWSRGLKALVGLNDVADEDAATDETSAEIERHNIEAEDWSPLLRSGLGAQHRRAAVLDAAEAAGAAGVARVVASDSDDDDDAPDLLDGDDIPERTAPTAAARPGHATKVGRDSGGSNMTEAERKFREAVAAEREEQRTHEADRAKYEAAIAKLVGVIDAGGGFAEALGEWLPDMDRDPLISLLGRADPWNRAALLEVVAGFRRFGVAPEIATRFPKPDKDYAPFPVA